MADKSQNTRPRITLVCSECRGRSYTIKKNRHNTPDRLEPVKCCLRCHKSAMHRETR